MDFQDVSGSHLAPPEPPQRRGGSGWMLALLIGLIFFLSAPYWLEIIQFSLTRGELRARGEQARLQAVAAKVELSELAKNAELVKLSDTSRAFRLVAQRVGPSVVHIGVESDSSSPPGGDDIFGPWDRRHQAMGQGSGVIVDAAGYVLTNFHVVQNATAISVELVDGRIIDDVEVVGVDSSTDLAVLKIDATELTPADWGDSDDLQVGDWVLAVGNPFGLDRTVTSGIVSAKQRRVPSNASPFQDFLQTDAAVNPGNSGGPLVNVSGEIVGITTAIVGEAYQGISFAIPSNLALDIYKRIRAEGSVARGYLGVHLENLTPELALRLNIEPKPGVLVVGVKKDTPGDVAGVAVGDIISRWNDQPVKDKTELTLLVGKTEIGADVKVIVWRDGVEKALRVKVGRRPPDEGRPGRRRGR